MLERFRSGVKLKSLFLQSGDNNQPGDRRFPMSEGEVDVPFILARRLARVRTAAIRDYGRALGATLNDLAMTSLYRCLFRLLGLSSFPLFSWSVSLSENRFPLFQDTLYANQRLRRL